MIAVGDRVRWRRSNGAMTTMVVDMIHEQDGDVWLFSRVREDGSWLAVNHRRIQ